MKKLVGVVCGALCFFAAELSAQTAQRFSIQASYINQSLFGGDFSRDIEPGDPEFEESLVGGFPVNAGNGFELQLRYNPGLLSFGLGLQGTTHTFENEGLAGNELTIAGVFIEPRYVIPVAASTFAPYASARLASSAVSLTEEGSEGEITATGTTVNLGGGVLFRLGGRVNLDLGLTVGYQNLGAPTGEEYERFGAGFNTVARAGIAVGIGR